MTTMTVVTDNYTGHVEPGTAARRVLPGATIIKASVGPMDNNAYLISCTRTGETLLIDAANDAEVLLELIERYAPKLSLIVTSHQRWDHWQALEAVAKVTGAPTAAPTPSARHSRRSGPRRRAGFTVDIRSPFCCGITDTPRDSPADGRASTPSPYHPLEGTGR